MATVMRCETERKSDRTWSIFRIWILAILALGLGGVGLADESMNLKVGEVRQFLTAPGTEVVVGNSRVLGYQSRPDGVVVTARAAGFSELTVGGKRYGIHVIDNTDLEQLAAAAREILSDVEGVTARNVAGQVLLTGTVARPADVARCQQVADKLGLVSLVEEDSSQHFPSPLIQLSFHFAEVNRDGLRKLGIGWGNGILTTIVQGLGIANGVVALGGSSKGAWNLGAIKSENGAAAPEDAAVNFNEAFNLVRVHDQHDVVVMNGQTDEYKYGGSLFIPVTSGLSSSLEQVEYGIRFKVTPDMDRDRLVRMTLEYEVSDIAGDAPRGTYKLNKREGKTIVQIREGQTLAISGIVRHQNGRGANGWPGFIHSPALEWLFGVHSQQDDQIDGVVFVTPTLYVPAPEQDRNRILRVTSGSDSEVAPMAEPQAPPAASAPERVPSSGTAP